MPTGPVTPQDAGTDIPRTRKTISRHWLYVAVIVAVVAGTAFVNLITMIIGPIIFCTIVLGIRSVNKASQVGRVGAIAPAPGALVGNLVHPGEGLQARHAGSGRHSTPIYDHRRFSYDEDGGTT